MSVRTTHRIAAVGAPLLAAALVLGACGGSDTDAESRPTIELTAGETAFVTIAPASTIPEAAQTPDDETTEPGITEYTIQAGDFPLGVADKFGASLEDIAALNGWTNCLVTGCPEFPGPGTTIIVPGSAAVAPSNDTTEVAAETDTEEVVEGETGEAIPEPAGDTCEAGSYTIEAGDFEGRVADKFDITVDELRAANAQTANYSVFFVGLDIVIPARDNC
ncbi:MAG: LysM peptidoglycan-binding domain-containing protein [Ilumatobacter sp.]